MHIPNLIRLGLANIRPFAALPPALTAEGAYGKASLCSPGKDTTAGHWEMAGIILDQPLPTYPRGFPAEIIEKVEQAIGRKLIGNYPASGTEIIRELGEEHMWTGSPIVYTSADSVFQIAAHEDVISVEELYRISKICREILQGKHRVGRVIARPFEGTVISTAVFFLAAPQEQTVMMQAIPTPASKRPGRSIVDLNQFTRFSYHAIALRSHPSRLRPKSPSRRQPERSRF